MPSLSIPTIHSSPTLRLIIFINHSIHYNPSYLLLLHVRSSRHASLRHRPSSALYPDHHRRHHHHHHHHQPKYTTNLKTLYLQYIWRTWILFHTTHHCVYSHTHYTYHQSMLNTYLYGNLVINSISICCLLIGASIARRKSKMITTSLILLVFLTFWDSITLSQAQCYTLDLTCGGCILPGPCLYPSELTYPTISGGVSDCCCQSEADCIVDRIFKTGSANGFVLITGNCE